jgi:hypothetical protein
MASIRRDLELIVVSSIHNMISTFPLAVLRMHNLLRKCVSLSNKEVDQQLAVSKMKI